MGWFSVPPYCSSDARCNSESMRGTMKRFEKGTLELFKAGRKSVNILESGYLNIYLSV